MKLSTIWTTPGIPLRERLHRTAEWALLQTAQHMPRRLAYWVLIDQGARASTGRYSDTVVPDMTFMTVVKRAEK